MRARVCGYFCKYCGSVFVTGMVTVQILVQLSHKTKTKPTDIFKLKTATEPAVKKLDKNCPNRFRKVQERFPSLFRFSTRELFIDIKHECEYL